MFSNKTESRDSLQLFLVKRFLLVILFIYVSQQGVTLLYRYFFTPILLDILDVKSIGYSTEALGSSTQLLIVSGWKLLSQSLPIFIQNFVSGILDQSFHIQLQAPPFIEKYGETMTNMYYMAIFSISIVELLLSVLPYFLSGWWYMFNIQKKMDELREEDRQQQLEYEKQRNLLFSDITHDIKTPITSIVGYSRALADGVISEPDKQQEYLNSIYSKSMRIATLITLLFEYVKLGSAGFTLHQEKCDLAELVRESVIVLLTDFEEKDIELDIDIPDDICLVYADKVQMSRVVTNLLTNAIRYIDKGHQVRITLEPRKSSYLVCVADDGLPIEEEFAKHIFDPFSRSDKARQTTSGGSGLGLSIAHKVAQMHGGELRLNLEYGQGYEKAFELVVPFYNEQDTAQS